MWHARYIGVMHAPEPITVIVSLLESGSVCGPRAYHCVVSLLSSGSVRGLFSIMCWLVTGSSTNMKVDNLCYINNACWMVWMLQRLVLFWITYPTIASLPTEMYITECPDCYLHRGGWLTSRRRVGTYQLMMYCKYTFSLRQFTPGNSKPL